MLLCWNVPLLYLRDKRLQTSNCDPYIDIRDHLGSSFASGHSVLEAHSVLHLKPLIRITSRAWVYVCITSRQNIFTLERCIIDDICIPRGQPGTQSWAKATTCCTTWCRLCDQDGWSQWMRTSSPECQKVLEYIFSTSKWSWKSQFSRYFPQVPLLLVVRIWTSWKWLSELVKQWMSPTEHSGIDLLILRSLAFQLLQFMDMT